MGVRPAFGLPVACAPVLAKKGEALLAAANWPATLISSGANACMRSSVKRTVGPAIVSTPIADWPDRTTGADNALRPRE